MLEKVTMSRLLEIPHELEVREGAKELGIRINDFEDYPHISKVRHGVFPTRYGFVYVTSIYYGTALDWAKWRKK